MDFAFNFLNSIGDKNSFNDFKKSLENQKSKELNFKLLDILVSALEDSFQDFLGEVYMRLNKGIKRNGEFFTPYEVSKLMASMTTLVPMKKDIAKLPYKILEPSSGAGGTVIAAIENILNYSDLNISHDLFIETWDINRRCVQMTFIQLSLLGVPAKIVHGNTLSLEVFGTYYTPVYYLNKLEYLK